MFNLKKFQDDMSAMIFGDKPSDSLLSTVSNDTLSPSDRLQIHKNNYKLTLSGALMDIFPVMSAFVGEEWLEAALKRFVMQYPPQKAALSLYGGQFSKFLEAFTPAQSMPYLVDIARLEWAIHQCQNEQDDAALTPNEFQALAGPDMQNLTFNMISAHRFIVSDYPLMDLWNVGSGKDHDGEIDLDSGGSIILVIRPVTEVLLMDVDQEEFEFLTLLNNHKTVFDAAQSVDWARENSPLANKMIHYVSTGIFSKECP